MANTYAAPTIDEYLRKRLMPVEGTIPDVQGIDMYGNSIPAGTVGGDLFEYINFQQRYDIDARIQWALNLSKDYLQGLPAGAPPRTSVDDHVNWLKSRPGYKPELESANMLLGEVPLFFFSWWWIFGPVPPLVFSAEDRTFMDIDKNRMVQFLPLGLHIPENHPDRNRYLSLEFREKNLDSSNVAELTLLSPGDIFFLYTDGVYDGSDKGERRQLEEVMSQHYRQPAKEICNDLLKYAPKRDDCLRQS